MSDLFLKCTFIIGLLLILFHSLILDQINPRSIPQATHIVTQNPQEIQQKTLSNVSQASEIIQQGRSRKSNLSQKNPSKQSSADYVERVLSRQKRLFKNCYVRYLKNHLKAETNVASITLSFNIKPPGKVSDVSVLGGSSQNTTLHKCMKAVVERVAFRHFSGPPTQVFYPIEFH